ncbi:uncharacterized protein ARMOST_07586 [Armillaria ostoyae]|uniref:Uncharacterized protein n=1 Tax=Armillaria ostoyae TaxID=47428 RepID=A0A284R688_ARMOS|nr:uncharacterized protein ARMOST_07586 [Armillaria ostoyae]
MSESIASIHSFASQSTPPFHHLSDDSFAFPDSLAPLVLPVNPVDITDTDTRKVTRLWPSSVPLFTFAEHSQLLKHGRNKKLGNGLRTASACVLTHNQYTKIFPEETSILDCLLTSVSACTTFAKDVVYKLDDKIYQELLTRLTTRRSLAFSSLDTFGYSDLRPPVWAIDTTKGLTANDFEIYALQYRIHVEHFLYILDDIHDWDECQTRMMLDENLLAAQRNADRAHLGKQEYYLPTVPPASHSSPLKSKTSRQNSVSDWSLGGVQGIIAREEEQYSQKKTVPNLKALDYDTNTSISQNLTADGVVAKQESKRLLTRHPRSVAFNTVSSKRNLPEKSEHNQLNQRVRLINSLDDVPSDCFITFIAVSSGFISGDAETNFLACSTSLALTAPLSKVDTKIVGHKRGIIDELGSEVKDTETRIQGYQRLATISSADEAIVDESNKRRNDGNHHQYRSSFGNTFSASESAGFPLDRAKLPPAFHERQCDSPFSGDHFEFTVEIILEHSSADSLALLSEVPNPDFDSDSSSNDEPNIPEDDDLALHT